MASIDRALAWAAAGWPVFPCRPNKRPWFSDWQEVATTNARQINKWWENDDGSYEVGVVPAMANPPCFVLDVDVKNGKDGLASLRNLALENGFAPEDFPMQNTPSGGRHYFLRGEFPTTVDALGEGLDTRGGASDGTGRGYIIAYGPPMGKPASIPASTLPQTISRRKASEARYEPRVLFDLADNVTRAKSYLQGLEPVEEGSRNATLFKHACMLKDLGLSVDKVFELVEEYPATLGEPPLDDPIEIQATIRSAFTNGQAQPGQHAIDPEVIKRLVAEEALRVPEIHDAGVASVGSNARGKRLRLWPEIAAQKAPDWIVKGLIPDASLVGIFGPGGSYKSFIALDLALSIATGQPEWAGQQIRRAGPVVIIQGEGRLDNRALAWQATHCEIGERMAMIPGMNLNDPSDVEAVAKVIKQAQDEVWFGPPALIIIDTLARASGGADENSSRDMGVVIQHCDALRMTFGCSVVLVHHTPKNEYNWRGSTAVFFALDTALAIRGENLKVHMEVVRQKDGEVGHEWAFKLKPQPTGRIVDDEEEVSLVVSDVIEITGVRRDQKETAQTIEAGLRFIRTVKLREILEALPEGQTLTIGMAAKAMAADTNSPAATMRGWLTQAIKEGTLAEYVVMNDPIELAIRPPSSPCA